MSEFGKVILLILLMIPIFILSGVILNDFWRWFVIPVFNLPYLGIGPAIGLSMTAHLFVGSSSGTSKDVDDDEFLHRLLTKAFSALAFWGIGAIIVNIIY